MLADTKPPGDLMLRAALIDSRGHWLSEIHRIGAHDNVLLSQDFQLKWLKFATSGMIRAQDEGKQRWKTRRRIAILITW
jgi:hypothetical protein